MIYRATVINRMITRSWEKLLDREVTHLKPGSSSNSGTLNVAAKQQYDPGTIEHCDLKIIEKHDDSETGTEKRTDCICYIPYPDYVIDECDLFKYDSIVYQIIQIRKFIECIVVYLEEKKQWEST